MGSLRRASRYLVLLALASRMDLFVVVEPCCIMIIAWDILQVGQYSET